MRARRRDAWLPVATVSLTLFVCLAAVELGGQLYAGARRPSSEVLFLEPDPRLGWRHVPGLSFMWTGGHWYARDFSAPVSFNAQGWRGEERPRAKPAGTRRLAVLGDSLVEALQVPLEKTAVRLAEDELGKRWQALNFGVSNYGVGQFLLAWELQAKRYRPDVVAVLVGGVHIERAVQPEEGGAFPSTQGRRLRLRPMFALKAGRLERRLPEDYAEFARLQAEVLENELGGRHERQLPRRSFLRQTVNEFRSRLRARPAPPARDPEEPAIALSLALLGELARQTRAAGARLVLVDVSRHFAPETSLPARLEAFCARSGVAYVDLSRRLVGGPVSWPHDAHFNERGNALFAEALAEAVRKAQTSPSPKDQ